MMLDYFKENDLVHYSQEEPTSWEEAIKISCMKLIKHNFITDEYVNEIINSVKKHGPYIVILPQVAIPHADSKVSGVLGTGISFTKFPNEVIFYDEKLNEKKKATLFFTLAAKNSEEHLENIVKLTDLLQDQTMIKKLLETNTIEEYNRLLEK